MRMVGTGEFEGGSVFIDGDWKPLSEGKVSLFDWGFTRSDVTYDVASVWHGAFFRLDDHLDRFFSSLDKLRMKIPYSRGADTSCVVDAQGNVAEGPGFNVFMVKGGVVRTPDRGVLEGISRRTVIELCGTLGIALRIEPVPATDLASADEVFISSTGGGVLPIAKIDGRPIAEVFPGPITKRLQDAYWALHDDPRFRDPVEY